MWWSISPTCFCPASTSTAYDVSGRHIRYDPTTFTATWTLPQAIGPDKLLLQLNADGSDPIEDSAGNRLDGEWTNPTSTTQSSSALILRATARPGAISCSASMCFPAMRTRTATWTLATLSKLLGNYGKSGMTWAQGDFTGDGVVDV